MARVLRSVWFWVLVVAMVLVVGAAGALAVVVGGGPDIDDGSWLVVDLRDDLMTYDPPADLMSQLSGDAPPTLQGALDNLAKAAADERIAGVIVKLGITFAPGAATVGELRQAIAGVRAAGKPVVAWAESLNPSGVHLAGACDTVALCPTGQVLFTGTSLRSMHVKGLMEKLGIQPNLHQIKDYKSAAEMLTRTDMSAPARENRRWLLDELWELRSADLESDRGLPAARVEELMQHALFTGQQAEADGLVDELWYWDDLESALKADDEEQLALVSQSKYAEVSAEKLGLTGAKKIAVVHVQGMIGGRSSGVNPLLGLMIGHETVNADLRRVEEDEDVAAVVFRIDSPGGSALTSDLIGHQVEVLARSKPVVASMVNVAASGGYHVAYRATRIVAAPTTITGSIGSISGKFNMKGMYDSLGISFDRISRGPMADLYSEVADFTPEERARFEDNHWDGFNHWLTDVAEHRGMTFEQAEKLAHGRVWSGRQAVANGLVDELGGYQRAVEVAKELAGIPADEAVTVVHYPEKKSLLQILAGGEGARATVLRWWLYRAVQQDLGELRQLAVEPSALTDPITVQ